jgi:hypothetical protein
MKNGSDLAKCKIKVVEKFDEVRRNYLSVMFARIFVRMFSKRPPPPPRSPLQPMRCETECGQEERASARKLPPPPTNPNSLVQLCLLLVF